jgi:hypothetical protein
LRRRRVWTAINDEEDAGWLAMDRMDGRSGWVAMVKMVRR